MFNNPVIYVLIIVSALLDVKGQVCFKAVRGKYATGNKFIITRICCKGYATEPGTKEISVDTCKPICYSNCTNGYCKYPGECACNAGYTMRDGACVAHCEKCSHGACVPPDTCQCDSGYSLVNGTCQPVCTTPCVNGTCVSPNTCQCLPGYERSHLKETDCEPICSSGCMYGVCEAPETCICYPGGVCIAPNKCQEETQTITTLPTANAKRKFIILEDSVPVTKGYFTFYWSSTENLVDVENSNVTLENSTNYSWMQQNQIILISTVVIVTTGIIVFIVWRRIPMKIIYFFKGKSYNIKGASLRRNVSNSFVNIQFLSRVESRG